MHRPAGDLLHEIIVKGRGADGIDAVPHVHRPAFQLRVPRPLPDNERDPAQEPGDELDVERHLLTYGVDVGDNLDDQQRPVVTGDEIETPGPQGKALGDIETGRDHDTGDQLELAVLGHVVTNGWSVPIY